MAIKMFTLGLDDKWLSSAMYCRMFLSNPSLIHVDPLGPALISIWFIFYDSNNLTVYKHTYQRR